MLNVASNDRIDSSFTAEGLSLYLKREDLLHPEISGNKYRKLKYNLQNAKELRADTLLTFGGAYSNHVAAVAAAGKLHGFTTIAIIRGEELATSAKRNNTLQYAESCGMKFHFVSREAYKQKNTDAFIRSLHKQFGKFYLIPEGGTNDLAVKGCEEILTQADSTFDYICVSVGTGGTISGIINASETHQEVIGFSALKGNIQTSEIKKHTSKSNFEIIDRYSFGGYAKVTEELVDFINRFKTTTGIQLDPIYTGKMMFGITELSKNGYFKKNSRILAIHTGGLQGIFGINEKLKKKNLPQIIV